MSSLDMHSPVPRMNNRSKLNRRSEPITPRVQVSSGIGNKKTTSNGPALPAALPTNELEIDDEFEPSTNHGNILFVCLDDQSQLPSNSTTFLRAINNEVQTYTDPSSCLDFLQTSTDQIFFISSFIDKQLFEDVHNAQSVEAMFIVDSDAQVDNRFPKWYGVYPHLEGLLLALKNTLQWFEQTQMELFVFERDRIFLWSQLWKEELIRVQKSKVSSSSKEKLVEMAENYYRGNIKINNIIKDFNQFYVKSDALQWCFFSRFPSVFLHRALHSHNAEQIQACRFLFNDVSRMIQLGSRKSSCELYKGMKMTNELLDKLENHVGKLICPKGFLQCTQSRKIALEVASSLDHRPDLMPVLFKITYDASVPIAELHNKDTPAFLIFDIYTVFRVKYVTRGPVSIIKIEVAEEGGTKLAREYRMKHKKESIQTLLDQILYVPIPEVKLPPPREPSPPPRESSPCGESPPLLSMFPVLLPSEIGVSITPEDADETEAQHLIEHGDIDQAIYIYQRIKPESSRIFHIIATLYIEKKGDYDSAIQYFEKALRIQEEEDEDDTRTLTELGVAYQNRRDFDVALSYHFRALEKRKKMSRVDPAVIASNLIGIANAYWGQKDLTEALNYAQQALTLNESIERGNETNIATNLAILANIYHNAGDGFKALELATRALGLLESCSPPDLNALATLINNVATIQVSLRLFTDARHSFDRALEICKKSLPEGHPKRVTLENNIQRIISMEERNEKNF